MNNLVYYLFTELKRSAKEAARYILFNKCSWTDYVIWVCMLVHFKNRKSGKGAFQNVLLIVTTADSIQGFRVRHTPR